MGIERRNGTNVPWEPEENSEQSFSIANACRGSRVIANLH